MEHMSVILKNMVEDVMREGAGEIVDSKEVRKAISKKTSQMFKDSLKNTLSQLDKSPTPN